MRVDAGSPRTIINEGTHQFMELEEPLYLGGLPASVKESAVKKWHIRNTSSFSGNRVFYVFRNFIVFEFGVQLIFKLRPFEDV